jgi:hypothetical protein
VRLFLDTASVSRRRPGSCSLVTSTWTRWSSCSARAPRPGAVPFGRKTALALDRPYPGPLPPATSKPSVRPPAEPLARPGWGHDAREPTIACRLATASSRACDQTSSQRLGTRHHEMEGAVDAVSVLIVHGDVDRVRVACTTNHGDRTVLGDPARPGESNGSNVGPTSHRAQNSLCRTRPARHRATR